MVEWPYCIDVDGNRQIEDIHENVHPLDQLNTCCKLSDRRPPGFKVVIRTVFIKGSYDSVGTMLMTALP